MTRNRAIAFAACLTLAGCVQPAPEPTPVPPSPAPSPAPTPPPVAQPVYENWMDAPATPGDWHLRTTDGRSQAVFGPASSEAAFALTCNPAQRAITLTRAGSAGGEATMHIRTETRQRTLSASIAGRELPTIAATLPANDPLLAAMAFSKGRFAVETPSLPTLYIPAWPEMTRVIEDCL
ncbi:hypothetical protein [Pelagerythrobacter marensis]|uniref:Lipoprotein n=1 Tax=Pelagerythrobacter marensis TaxID=543877 RepID=A0A0G3X5X2_9SPHN|nr:hypothetical protein [Pelagerythrobacter marensis]AKM06567.1 hypothetical protein AM2010_480 [Pelagerythrobacter marensis]